MEKAVGTSFGASWRTLTRWVWICSMWLLSYGDLMVPLWCLLARWPTLNSAWWNTVFLTAPGFHAKFFSSGVSSLSCYNQRAFLSHLGKLSEAPEATGWSNERELTTVSVLKFYSVLSSHSAAHWHKFCHLDSRPTQTTSSWAQWLSSWELITIYFP